MLTRTSEYYRLRAEMLEKKNYEMNKRIILKLLRKAKKLEKFERLNT